MLATLFALVLALGAGAGAPAPVSTTATARAAAPEPLAVLLDLQRGLDASAAEAMARAAPGTRTLVHGLRLPGSGGVVLELERFEALRADARFDRGAALRDDAAIAAAARGVSCWRGRIQGDARSHAYLAVSERGLMGWVEQSGVRHAIVPADPQARGLVAGVAGADGRAGAALRVVESRGSGSPLAQEMCRMLAHEPEGGHAMAAGAQIPARRRALDIAVDTDHELWQLFDDDAVATQYLVALWGAISDIYLRDHDIVIRISYLRLWPGADDGMDQADPLGPFRDRWEAEMGAVDRDAATLMSGRRNLPYGGIAWVFALCSEYAYSVTGYIIGTFADPVGPDHGCWDINVCAHELGHNCGTYHTHDYGIDNCAGGVTRRGEIMSYCHVTSGGSANIDLRFTTVTQQYVRDFVSGNAPCLSGDCNLNGIDDALEIAQGLVADANGDGIPDACQDCDGDGVLDPDAIALGAPDLDGNGIPDACDPDCNGNGVVDAADIAAATSEDVNLDGVPDECELDCDGDGQADSAQIIRTPALDLDRDGRLDACQDCDADGTRDLDATGRALCLWVGSSQDGALRELHGFSGVRLRSFADAQNSGAATALNDVILADGIVLAAGGRRVYRWDRLTGAFLGALVVENSLDGARALCMLPDGRLAVAWQTPPMVRTYDAQSGGSPRTIISGGGAASSMRDMIVSTAGTLLASCADDRVREYALPSGTFLRIAATAAAGADLGGLLELPDGRLLVSSRGQDAILAFDRATGASLGRFDIGAVAGSSTALTDPDGLALTDDGRTVLAASNGSNAAINGYQVATGYYTRAYRIYAVDAPKPTAIAVVPPSALDVNRDLVPDTCQRVGDLNGDGAVDGADLGLLLGSWGLTGGLADLNADARVDGADLGILLGNWGV